MIQDAQGHHLSGATEAAVTAYDQAVRAFNLVHGDSIGLFDAAQQAAPHLAMAALGKAWVFALANDPGASKPISPPCPIWSKAPGPQPSRCSTAT